MKQKILIIIAFFLFFNFGFVLAQEKIEVYFFYSATCPHCAKEKVFLEELEKKYPQVEVKKFGLFESKNVELLRKLYQDYKVPSEIQGYVPLTFFGERYFLGFDEKIGQDIENCLLELIKETSPEKPCPPEEQFSPEKPLKEIVTHLEKKVKIPILGEVDISKLSLPVLAVVLGFFDGFNVCSLGALVLILGIVLALKQRSKILILGGTFVLTTGIIYGILIFLWHKIFLVLSLYLRKMEILIGVLAILAGIHFLREFLKFRKKGPVCEFGGISQNLSQKIQKAFEEKKGILALVAVVFSFAAIVTIVEFPCSAALPVVFAGVLTAVKIPVFLTFLYIFLYLFFYLLDEIILFLLSVFTLKIWVTSPKFVNFLNLATSIVLFFLGIYYLFGLV